MSNPKSLEFALCLPGPSLDVANMASHRRLDRRDELFQLCHISLGHQTHSPVRQILYEAGYVKFFCHATDGVSKSNTLDSPFEMDVNSHHWAYPFRWPTNPARVSMTAV